MFYVVIDPVQTYPVYMIHFLARFGLKALSVFSDRQSYNAYRHLYGPVVDEHVADEYLASDFDDVGALAQQMRADNPGEIHGIIPWDELNILLGAELGQALGLDWNPPETIQRFRNKYIMKEALRQHRHLRINHSQVVSTMEEVEAFQQAVGGWPIVVKPTEGAGSSGVFFAQNMEELADAAVRVFHHGWGQVLLEEFVGGTEFVVNGLTDADGTMLITDAWRYDKRDIGHARNVYFQTLKVSTTEPVFGAIASYAVEVVQALGLRKAPVHMELKVDERGPCLIEVGARFAGGNQPMLASELHGQSLFELAATHYLSDDSVTAASLNRDRYDGHEARIVSGVQVQALPYITRILGADEVRSLPSFFGFGKLLPLGAPVPQTQDVMTRCYEVYLIHPDKRQIEYDAEQVRALLRYI